MFAFFKKLFNRNRLNSQQTVSQTIAVESPVVETLPAKEQPIAYYPTQWMVGTGQNVGRQRDHNEDALYTSSTIIADGDSHSTFGVFVVADGMGGHQHGEVASGSATRAFGEYLNRKLYSIAVGNDAGSLNDSMQELMEHAVRDAHLSVVKKAPGGGTTLTAALVLGDHITIAHVGDSRAYILSEDGQFRVMTQDHSLVRRLVELGQLTEEQARVYPQKNVLYRALGQLEPFKPDIHTHHIPHPGYLMICSDGLWGLVSDNEMLKVINQNGDPCLACHKLVEAANLAGGPDNISVILVKFT